MPLKQRQFVLAARARGCSDLRIIYRHIMPNILPLLLLYTAFNIAWSIIAEAGAAFLGFGDPEPSLLGRHAVRIVDLRPEPHRLVVVRLALRRHHLAGERTGLHLAAPMRKSPTRA